MTFAQTGTTASVRAATASDQRKQQFMDVLQNLVGTIYRRQRAGERLDSPSIMKRILLSDATKSCPKRARSQAKDMDNESTTTLPAVRLKIARRSSHPWIFQKMVEKPATRLPPGSV